MEILYGFEIKIENITLDFAKGIEETAALLDTISKDKTQLSEGEYFFKDLKLAIASHEARGGEGNELAYFYCSNDVSHLIKN